MLAGLGGGRQRRNGVGESILDIQGTGQEVVEAVLDRQRVTVREQTGLTHLSRQDIRRAGRLLTLWTCVCRYVCGLLRRG